MRKAITIVGSGVVALGLTIKAIFQRDKKLVSNLGFFWAIVLLFPFVALVPGFGNFVARVLAYPLLWITRTDEKIRCNLRILLGNENGIRPYTVSLHLAREYVQLAQNRFRSDSGVLDQYVLDESALQLVERWRQGRRFILVGGHLGYPQAAISALAAHGLRFFVPTESLQPGVYRRFIDWLRMPRGCVYEPIEGTKTTLLKARRYLRRDKPLIPALLFDRVPVGEGKVYPLCGGFNEFGVGPAVISRLTGAEVYFGVAVDEGIGKPTIYISGPIIPQVSQDRATDIDLVMQELVGCYESWLRLYPEQLTGAAQMNILSTEEVGSVQHHTSEV